MKTLGFQFTDYETEELFISLDRDKDAKINCDEFSEILNDK